jgi:uncharacterized membrane protein
VEAAAKLLLAIAAVLALVGLALFGLSRLGLDRLPGDVVLRHGNFTLYAPVALMILVSIVLTILLNLLWRR